MKKIFYKVLALFTIFLMFFGFLFNQNVQAIIKPYRGKVINDFEGVANYLRRYNKLPPNYIVKSKAKALGWEPGKCLDEISPRKSIGGDIFLNCRKRLPMHNERVWYECDINYEKGPRNALRLVYSNDGYIYKTENHYTNFTLMYEPRQINFKNLSNSKLESLKLSNKI